MKLPIKQFFCSVLTGFVLLFSTAGVVCAENILRLATTTSTDNSGLTRKLLPVFETKFGIDVHTIVSGTGRAINHARNGDVDMILVHAKEAELKFIEDGFGVDRQEIMYNEFVIVGPADDPAGVNGLDDLSGALARIAGSQSTFVSRGDDSGTHKKELRLWEQAGIEISGGWYKEVGLGMGKALQIANEFSAYTLSDKGTYLFMRDRLSLPVHVESAMDGKNLYGVIAVNPKRHPHVNYDGARKLIRWLKSEEARSIISDYKVNGEQLFFVID
ncbi:MAG: substrate-binding domain-containing protein [Acidiferrobacterales bacterium]|nr:substrate-binding domain-containing protein [Acidiferrobacterales bacterium]